MTAGRTDLAPSLLPALVGRRFAVLLCHLRNYASICYGPHVPTTPLPLRVNLAIGEAAP